MKLRLVITGVLSCVSAFAQSPPCIQIADTNVWGIGGAGANGTIKLTLGQALVVGGVTYPASETYLTVTAGTLYGPDGLAGYCAAPGAAITASYSIARTGPAKIATGSAPSTRAWTIPASGGPYAVKDVETATLNPPSAKFPATLIIPTGAVADGTYCLQIVNHAVTGVVACSSSGGALSWASLINSQWTSLTNSQWTALTN